MNSLSGALVGHPSRNKEGNSTEDDLNCGGPAQEVLEGKNVNK